MRKELFIHFSFWFSFFVFITIARHYFDFLYWPIWLGGVVGMFLPDIDHILYVLLLRPEELTSQRFAFLLGKKETWRAIEILYETRSERRGLIFHTILFQLIFLVLTFWMVTSSGSIFGKGLALSFAMHLVVDEIVDLTETGNLDNWLKLSPIKLDLTQSKTYWVVMLGLVLLMGLFI